MAGTFRYTVWDPLMILAQMATLQCAYYVSLGLWIFFFDLVAGSPRSLDHIFKYEVRIARPIIRIGLLVSIEYWDQDDYTPSCNHLDWNKYD